jgi:tetratricopeptide (TPR) repeat protein
MAVSQISFRKNAIALSLAAIAALLLGGAFLPALIPAAAAPQESSLGKLDFSTSCSARAQGHFERGVLALHSFWYEESLEAFRASTKEDPNCAMGYWGEAMALNHPIWHEQETEEARGVLARIPKAAKLTPRESAYIDAVRALYGEGDKRARDRAYLAAMEKLHGDYPDDLEAASFYALSLLGVYGYQKEGHAERMRAGAVALAVHSKTPGHPGAAHYIIHSYDDPEHAILALPAALRYARIAPEAHHARHMPSHIFIQLGMWPEAVASNESAWQASVNWVKRKNLSGHLRDYHSLHWLQYAYLQQGRLAKAEEAFQLRRKTMAEPAGTSKTYTASASRYYADMAAEIIAETENWPRVAELFPEAEPPAPTGGPEHVHGPAASGSDSVPQRVAVLGAFLRGWVAATAGQRERVENELKRLEGFRESFVRAKREEAAKLLDVMQLEIRALHAAQAGEFDKAVQFMERAASVEESLPAPSGPPDLIKPSHEVFGEILLRAGRPQEAEKQFAKSLGRQPNRVRSLLGQARATAQSGDKEGARVAYNRLLQIWRYADAQTAELREAREFVGQKEAGNGPGR